MPPLPIFFAADLLGKLQTWRVRMRGDFYLLVFVGAFLLVTLCAFAWALVFRKQPHRHRHHHHHPDPVAAAPRDESSGKGAHSRRRHKHQRKEHRPVNPTLAETGGLPAKRDDHTPPKSHL